MFIGHTRFSLYNPRSSSWKATNGRFTTPEEYEAYLYSDERLGPRCRIFLEYSLPQLQIAAKDHELVHVVSYSVNMPEKYKALLVQAVERFSFLELDEHGPTRRPTDLMSLAGKRAGPGDAFGTYRLDDDDLLTADYFDQVAAYVVPGNAGMQVSLASGYTALYEDGRFTNFRETYWPMLAIGLLSVHRFNVDGSVTSPAHAPHHLSDRSNPVILDARRPAYIWTRHTEQDTAMDYTPEDARAKVVSLMSQYPKAKQVLVDSLFPALMGSVVTPRVEVIFEGEAELAGPLAFRFSEPQNVFSVEIEAQFGEGAVQGNALVSLDLVDEMGAPVSPAGVTIAGVPVSANPSVGFYQYLDSVRGTRITSLDFDLPTGVLCAGIRIQHWKRRETMILLRSVTLST